MLDSLPLNEDWDTSTPARNARRARYDTLGEAEKQVFDALLLGLLNKERSRTNQLPPEGGLALYMSGLVRFVTRDGRIGLDWHPSYREADDL